MNALVKSLVKHLTQEIVTDTKVICDNCGWSWNIKDGGDDLYICHNILPSGDMCKHDNNPNLNEKDGSAIPYGSGFAPYKKNNVNELGEGTAEPFKWSTLGSYSVETYVDKLKAMKPEYGEGTYQYAFKSDNADYVVNTFIRTIPPSTLDGKHQMYVAFGFGLRSGGDEITNYQEQYRVMATVLDIIANFVNIVDDNIDDVIIKEIQFHPKADSGPGNDTNSRRGKLYKEYINKNLDKFHKRYKLELTSKTLYLTPADDFPIKENQTKAWDLKEGIVFLSKYMLDNGLNIKPLPKIKFIKDDEENASNMLGKTAYYNPSEKSITLYTFGRHPKDILRSFSHEMIHHMQNLENRLNNINTTNTNEDGDLPELEREAYELGNTNLRKWEDSLKN